MTPVVRTREVRSATKIPGVGVNVGSSWAFACAGELCCDPPERSAQHAFRTGVLQQSCAALAVAGPHAARAWPAYAGTIAVATSATTRAAAESADRTDLTRPV